MAVMFMLINLNSTSTFSPLGGEREQWLKLYPLVKRNYGAF